MTHALTHTHTIGTNPLKKGLGLSQRPLPDKTHNSQEK